MAIIDPADVQPGDRLARWVWDGSSKMGAGDGGGHDMQALNVVRVNPTTYTVRVDNAAAGVHIRVPHGDIVDRADWSEDE